MFHPNGPSNLTELTKKDENPANSGHIPCVLETIGRSNISGQPANQKATREHTVQWDH